MWGTVQDITDRKRAEENLRRTQFYLSEGERLAHVGSWASTNLGISWSDDLGLYWSDELYRIFGLDPKNGAPGLEECLSYVHSQDRALIAENVKAMHEQHCSCDVTHRIVRPDGEMRYIRVVSNPVVEQGAFKGYIGTTIDVTEQELLTQELRRQQAYLAEAQRLTHNGSWACNLVTRQIFHSSDENARLYGFDLRQGPIPFDRYYNTILAEDESRLRVVLEDAIRAGKDYDVEFRIRRTDGAIRFMRGIGHHDPSGEPGHYVGITMDITERELLNQELRRQQAYLADAQSLTHVGSWACNFLTGKIFHLSDEALRLYGYDPGAPGISFELLYKATHPEDEPALREQFYGAINARRDYDLEYRIFRLDGTIRCLRSLGRHDPSQEIGEYIGITMDITERKRAEEERERLRQLEADLAHINRVNMMGELAAALAHEIKQPIAASVTSASACLRWLAHEPPDIERARAAAARIQQEGNRAADIINSLRSFYKVGSPAERQSVDVQGAIGEMTALLRTEAKRHSVTIRSLFEAQMPHILADRVQLQQVLMNLMLNAIEAMNDTGGELTIRSRVNPEAHITVSISDTGVGLPAEGMDLIFDPFHTTKPQGTGMGLTITRSIVESYGGRVWATANEGPGVTFHFTLPTGAEAHA
jgi:PAS domain S-box-containing protein